MDLIYWSVRLPSRRVGDEVNGVDGRIVILVSCEFHFIKVHENLVQHPSNKLIFLEWKAKGITFL